MITKSQQRVRAIIVSKDKILLINRIKENDSYWVIPGGKVEDGENLKNALKRECLEEIGVTIEIKKLFAQRISDKPETAGQYEFFYLCNIVNGIIGTGDGPEFKKNTDYEGKHIINWVDMKKLKDLNLKPNDIKDKIIMGYSKQSSI